MGWPQEHGSSYLMVGVILIAISLLLRRSRSSVRRGAHSNSLDEAKAELARTEATLEGKLASLEVRLHDIVRETEARLSTRIAMLQELLDRAEKLAQREPPPGERTDTPAPPHDSATDLDSGNS